VTPRPALSVNSFTNQPRLLGGLPISAWIVLALLLLLRLATYLHTSFSFSGDGVSYMKTAIFIGKHRVLPPLSIQPNGYGWLLSWFDVYKDPAAALNRIGRFQQWLDFSVVLALCWLAKKILVKTKPILLISAWTLILLQPFTGLWSRTIYSEQFVSFFSFAGFLTLSFFLFRRQRKLVALLGIALAGGSLGLASILRSDVLVLNTVLLAILAVCLAFFSSGSLRWRWPKIIVLLLSYIAIPLLMSSYQLASSGQFGIFNNDRDHEGYFGWIRTWPATPAEYEVFAFFSQKDLWTVDNYPAKAFDSEAEKQTFAAIMKKWKQRYYLAPSAETNAEFLRLTQEKIKRNPFRHYLLNPIIRVSYYWWNTDGSQFYTVPYALQRPTSTVVAGLILVARLLLLMLFLAGLILAACRPLFLQTTLQGNDWISFFCVLSCAYVLVRTLELASLSSFMIAGLMELRFISIAMPFFLVGALLGTRLLTEKALPGLRRRDRAA
jgi:hypothetical protein